MTYSRSDLLSMGFAHVGENVKVYKNTVLVNCHNIHLGDGCQIDDYVHIIASRQVRIGKRVHIACFTSIAGGGEVIIHDYAGLSAGCRLISGTEDFLGGGMTNPCVPEKYRKVIRSHIHIMKHAILGTNTIVFPGVTINEGAATGGGTIINKDLDAWFLYMGSPAKKVKGRPRDIILRLENELIREYGY